MEQFTKKQEPDIDYIINGILSEKDTNKDTLTPPPGLSKKQQ
tara:strand:- start:1289 stop:1414 length:126 start_codon:yes stop_codon:yes gene_type:complete